MRDQHLKTLVIDLDGTLIKTDLLVESLFLLLRQNPFSLFLLPFWLLSGKARLKQEIATRVDLDINSLPYNEQLIKYIEVEKVKGRPIVLATASFEKYAKQIAEHLDIFDQVLASNGQLNLSGHNKKDKLLDLFGAKGFVYAGNAHVDLKVWEAASSAIVVNPEPGLLNKVRARFEIEALLDNQVSMLSSLVKATRVHQWVKNILIFVPILLSHTSINISSLWDGIIAFFSFSLCASSVYLLNDLIDLPDDRKHKSKCNRPFASGQLSPIVGLTGIPILFLLSLALASSLTVEFVISLCSYFVLTLLYSFWLKRKVLIDVISLASLYTTRIIAGACAIGLFPSFWLLSFSMFFFLSLAIIKRYSELLELKAKGEKSIPGRGYESNDIELMASLGGSSGYVSVLVLALYLNSIEVRAQYTHPEYLWLICPIILYWISRAWLIAHRGIMHDDPIVWAIRDKLSHIAGITLFVIALFAK